MYLCVSPYLHYHVYYMYTCYTLCVFLWCAGHHTNCSDLSLVWQGCVTHKHVWKMIHDRKQNDLWQEKVYETSWVTRHCVSLPDVPPLLTDDTRGVLVPSSVAEYCFRLSIFSTFLGNSVWFDTVSEHFFCSKKEWLPYLHMNEVQYSWTIFLKSLPNLLMGHL